MRNALLVLDDCIRAHNALDAEEHDFSEWRIKWIGALTLIRMVGHVLRNVDGKDPRVRAASDLLFSEWKDINSDHHIFREFIEDHRNLALKEYEFLVCDSEIIPVAVSFDGRLSEQFDLPSDLFRPIKGGRWDGEDARDVYLIAINWWYGQLLRLSSMIAR